MFKFSYVICYRHQVERYKNLLKVTKYLKDTFKSDLELILVEQDKESKIPNPSLFDQHIFTYSDRPFNRSWAFNVGAKYSTTDKFFFGDCDLITPKKQMYGAVELLDTHGCVSPYNHVVDLNPMESEKVSVAIWSRIQRGSRPGINLTGGIVGFNKEDFYKIAGWCEDFEGWGGEDDFQTWKVRKWMKAAEIGGKVFHLYHPRPHIDQAVYRKNVTILNNINTKDPKQIVNWINNSKVTIGNKDKHVEKPDLDYREYLKDKRVCIVGPAPSIIGSDQKDLIESYDTVVRLNKSVPVPVSRIPDIGSRTDIYYHCMSQLPENGGAIDFAYLQNAIEFIASPYPNIVPFNRDISQFNQMNQGRLKTHIINKAMFLKFSKEMNTRPNSGICAIIDLLSFDIEELYITGFTFFKGGYDKTYRNQSEEQVMALINRYKVHEVEPQINYLRKLFESDPRLKGDKKLMEIINNEK